MNTLLNIFFSRVLLQRGETLEEFRVESLRSYKQHYILKLKGIDSIHQARELVGEEVLIQEEELRSLEEDNYYTFKIMGCAVFTKDGENIGTVEDVLFISGNELLVVKKDEQEILIPFVQSICLEVNLKQKRIVVDPPEGLLDLNEI